MFLDNLSAGYGDIVGQEGLPADAGGAALTSPAPAGRGFKVLGRVK